MKQNTIRELAKGVDALFNVFYRWNRTGKPKAQLTDADRLRSDWERVGKDMYKALERYESNN